MSQHPTPPPFSMPMFRECVPEKLRPWIYIVQAFCFQLGGCVYLGARGCNDVPLQQPCRNGYLLPNIVPYEVQVFQSLSAYYLCIGACCL